VSTYELAGKVLLITGAARGIGFETARIAHGRGASVVLVDLDQASADEAAARLGSRALALSADVVDLAAMEQAVSDSVDISARSTWSSPTPASPDDRRAIDADDWEKVVGST
jgi:NAD(P)-dependent dehydrogenase (short-subunit alcohol dehydrogenase family)